MNKVILMGNLTRDPEIRYSQGENSLAIARFGIAVNRRFARQGDTDTDFFNCTAFGRQAEFVEKYFRKGSRMLMTVVFRTTITPTTTVKKYTVSRLLLKKSNLQSAKAQRMQTQPRVETLVAVLHSQTQQQMMTS